MLFLLVTNLATSYSEAVVDQEWQKAMATELEALENNGTLYVVPLPSGKKLVACK